MMNMVNYLPSIANGANNAVAFNVLEKIGDIQASDAWGDDIARGSHITLTNASGDLKAYIFPYILGSKEFPNREEIFERIKRIQSKHKDEYSIDNKLNQPNMPASYFIDIEKNVGRFGSIYVSATKDNSPILNISNFIHPYFSLGELALETARNQLNRKNLDFRSIVFLNPHEEYFNFYDGDGDIYLHTRLLEYKTIEELTEIDNKFLKLQYTKAEIDKEWYLTENGIFYMCLQEDKAKHLLGKFKEGFGLDNVKLLPNWELVPVVNWTWWCVPTAFTMLIGYKDNYVKGKEAMRGYPRLISYWFDHPESKSNVPSFIDELIDPKTGNWRENFDFKTWYGYNLKKQEIPANKDNNWGWEILKQEIDAGRPVLWGVQGHTCTAIGYRESKWGNRVILYTTWGHTSDQQKEEWDYKRCIKLDLFELGNAEDAHIVLDSPYGGENLERLKPSEISWLQDGPIHAVAIHFSKDGGMNWKYMTTVPFTKKGRNSYAWTPNETTSKGRIMIVGINMVGDFPPRIKAPADGSHFNFSIS